MTLRARIFRIPQREAASFSLADALILLLLAAFLYLGIELATNVPTIITGPDISLEPAALPFYAVLSLGRMVAAYLLSLAFSITYGYTAARSATAQRWLLPLLDVLQSVPILSFLPVVLLALTAVLPQRVAVEIAAVVLIFTSQVWNLTFSFYQSMRTLPTEYREAAAVYRFSRWVKFKQVELPFAALGLIWNSVMSWSGGWFFLMAAEIFTLGDRDFRLPGLGAYLQTAASEGNTSALLLGLAVLILIIIALDQFVWRPLLAWAERFKVSQVGSDEPAQSWFLNSLRGSWLATLATKIFIRPMISRIDRRLTPASEAIPSLEPVEEPSRRGWRSLFVFGSLGLATLWGVVSALGLLAQMPPQSWLDIVLGALATSLRVAIAVLIALAWTIPVGVLIGTNPRAAKILQPVVQIAASIPATALFPVLLLGLLALPAGANMAAVILMLLGTQWYLLFNIIAGASAIPRDLGYTSDLLLLSRWRRWRTLTLPALFPYIVTGLITSSGGAWNASIVAEYTHFGGQTTQVTGLGSLITSATAQGNYPLLLASTLAMVGIVVLTNRFLWRRLYRLAETRYRMDQ
jgi:NitT/TauT family transport system permease protein